MAHLGGHGCEDRRRDGKDKGVKRQLRSVKWGPPSTWHRTGLRSRHGEIPLQFSVHDDSNDMETMSVDDFTDLDTSERSKGKLWRYT